MVQDRGGLRYVIDVPFDPTGTQTFRAEILASKEAWREFKTEIDALAASSKGVGQGLREIAKGARDSAKATKENAEAAGAAAGEIEKLSKAERKLRRDLDAHKTSIEARALADQKQIDIYKRLSRGATEQQAAEAKLAKILEKRRQDATVANLAQQRGIDLSKKRAQQLSIEAEVTKRIETANRRLAVAQALLNQGRDSRGNVIRQLTVEEEATKRLEAAKRRLAIAESLRSRGLDAQGNRLVKEFDAQAIALERVEAAARKTAIAEELRKRGYDAQGQAIKVKTFNAEAIALERIERANKKLAISEELRKRGRGPSGAPIAPAAGVLNSQAKAAERVQQAISRLQDDIAFRRAAQGSKELQALEAQLNKTDTAANRISFTFRRLFGILAAFAAARAVVQGFRDLVIQAVLFNARIEQATLGVATLLTAVGDVRDATGATVAPALALAKAQGIAKDQVRLLRLEALQTAATFDQLAETFQTALAPGLAAGLDVNKVREFAVEISKAAATIGLSQNQLSEEIRSILSGTIQQRTTRIAVALGITNEDIRRAKELGVLAEFLDERFQAFNEAGKQAQNIFFVVASNLKDALAQLAGAGAEGFFKELKNLFVDIQNAIVRINDEEIQVNPEAQNVVSAIFNGLTASVQEARKLRESLDFSDILPIAKAIGATFEVASKVASFFLENIVKGIGFLQRVAAIVLDTVREFSSNALSALPLDDLKQLLGLAIQIGTVLIGVNLSLKVLAGLAGLLAFPFIFVVSQVKALGATLLVAIKSLRHIGTLFAFILSPAGLLIVAVGAVVAGVVLLIKQAEKVGLKFGTIVEIVRVVLVNAVEAAAASFQAAFTVAINAVRTVFNTFVLAFEKSIQGIIEFAAAGGRLVGIEVDALEKAAASFGENANKTMEEMAKNAKEAEDAVAKAEEAIARAAGSVASGIFDALQNNDEAQSFDEFIGSVVSSAKDKLKDAFSGLDLGINLTADSAEPLSKVFSDLPGIVGKTNDELGETSKIIQELRDDLVEAGTAFDIGRATAGLSGPALRDTQQVLEAHAKVKERTLEIDNALKDAAERLLAVQERRAVVEKQVSKLSTDQQALVLAAEDGARKQLALEAQAAEIQKELLLRQTLLNKVKKEGDDEKAAAVQGEIDVLAQQASATDVLLAQQKQLVDQILAGVDPEIGARIKELVTQVIEAKGQDKVISEEITAIQRTRAEVEGLVLAAVEKRIAASAAQEIPNLQREIQLLEVQLAAERELASLRARKIGGVITTFTPQEEKLTEESGNLAFQRTSLTLTKEKHALDEQALQIGIDQTTDLEAKANLEQRLALLRRQNALEIDRQNESLAIQELRVAQIRASVETPVETGIAQGFENFKEQVGGVMEATTRIVEGSLNSLSSNISGRLTDAIFNPDEAASTKERIASFFKSVVTLIINELVRLIIVEKILAILKAFNGTGAPSAQVPNVQSPGGQFSKGGKARGGSFSDPYHHANAQQAFAHGGKSRGHGAGKKAKGVKDSRDRVPVWMRVGEWAIRPEAVRAYGDRFMRDLNEMRIDPMAARALLRDGSPQSAVVREPVKHQFATGGPIRGGLSTGAGRSASQALTSGQDGRLGLGSGGEGSGRQERVVAAYVVADNQNLERQLAGGRGALMDFFRDNASEISSVLQPHMNNPGR